MQTYRLTVEPDGRVTIPNAQPGQTVQVEPIPEPLTLATAKTPEERAAVIAEMQAIAHQLHEAPKDTPPFTEGEYADSVREFDGCYCSDCVKDADGFWENVNLHVVEAFAERELWPPFLTYDRARESTEQWAMEARTIGTLLDEPVFWVNRWPLPIGRAALESEGFLILHDLAPFEGNQWAAWIYTAEVGDATIECFGLANPLEGEGFFTVGPAAFRISTQAPPSQQIVKLCHDMARWWAHLGGKLFPPGRPPGTTWLTRGEVEARIDRFIETLPPGGRPTLPTFLACEPVIPKRTWYDWMRLWGTSWDQLRDARSGKGAN